MHLTRYHSSYFAHELTKRQASDSIEKLGTSLFNATVDLKPHQLDAALFAFRSPLSRGAILADEVGLGKTIEAGLIVSQLWAERKRRILIIAPTILRKQWAQELQEKFFIQSTILDTREFHKQEKEGDPLEPDNRVIICSYHFVKSKEREFRRVPWDLVVIDEAHRLRNVYQKSNKIARSIQRAVSGRPMVLLTATPLQNSLLELYGLVSFLDEHLFGDVETFRARYMSGPLEDRDLVDLRKRLRPICQRTLRRQVHEYVCFTNRIAMTQDFTPSPEEQELYERVGEYLRRPELIALPFSQRQLITLVLRKLLASSSFAIANTLQEMGKRIAKDNKGIVKVLAKDYEVFDEQDEEWRDADENDQHETIETLISDDDSKLLDEARELLDVSNLAASITTNAKGDALLAALKQGFAKLEEIGAPRKAVIFTESKRTQAYLFDLLSEGGYGGRILTINGTNDGELPQSIYKSWLGRHAGQEVVTGSKAIDLRAALVEHFRNHADILIATEAASEGVNLQFCSLVVNYDLPWNPQRIEQRIGRCHRYGQKFDVVVFNFINRSNAADRRVYELLSEKFNLFDGVFGASDEVLGALENGIDFERQIASIYQNCRTADEIDAGFHDLRTQLETQIAERMHDTRTKLLENFDEEVAQKLRHDQAAMEHRLDHLKRCLWGLTKFELKDAASFDDTAHCFELPAPLKTAPDAPIGTYALLAGQTDTANHAYRTGCLLAESLIDAAKQRALPPSSICFKYETNDMGRQSILEEHIGKGGWLSLTLMTINSLESEERLLWSVISDSDEILDPDYGEKLFRLPGDVEGEIDWPSEMNAMLEAQTEALQGQAVSEISANNEKFYDEENEKLERWAEDQKHALETAIKELDKGIRGAKKDASRLAPLEEKIKLQRKIKELENERKKRRQELFEAQDAIDAQRDDLIDKVEARLTQSIETKKLFSIRWRIE